MNEKKVKFYLGKSPASPKNSVFTNKDKYQILEIIIDELYVENSTNN